MIHSPLVEYRYHHRPSPVIRVKLSHWVFRSLRLQGPSEHHHNYPMEFLLLPRRRLWETTAEILLTSGQLACAVLTTCQNCQGHRCRSHLLRQPRLFGISTQVEVEAEETTILSETPGEVLQDGQVTRTTPLETTTEDHLQAEGLPAEDPQAADHQEDHLAVTRTCGPCRNVILWVRSGRRRTRSTFCRCLRLPLFARGRLL